MNIPETGRLPKAGFSIAVIEKGVALGIETPQEARRQIILIFPSASSKF